METQEAVEVVRALAGGLDPETSRPVEAGSILLKPQIVKALNRALGALVQLEKWERDRPLNAGRYWSHDEDAKVCEELRQGIDFHQIAKAHSRSVGSIVARLVKLGKFGSKTPVSAGLHGKGTGETARLSR